jgi:hypothetical protein
MNYGKRLASRSLVGLSLGCFGLAGCDSETADSKSAPVTVGIPTNRGPVSSKMPKPGTQAKSKSTAPAAH